MNFVMTDGRGIKGTSMGFVKGDLSSQNPFFSLRSGGTTVIAVRAAMQPVWRPRTLACPHPPASGYMCPLQVSLSKSKGLSHSPAWKSSSFPGSLAPWCTGLHWRGISPGFWRLEGQTYQGKQNKGRLCDSASATGICN